MLENEEVDIVSIATPESHHRNPAIAAAEAGKHLFIEKPLAHSMKDAVDIVHSARRHRVKLMVGYLLRFDARYAEGKRRIDNGSIGELISIWARRATRITTAKRVANWSNPLFYLSVHDIDLINWYVQNEVRRVYAEAAGKLFKDRDVPCVIHVLMGFKNGVTASLEVNWCRPTTWQYGLESRLHISGTAGVIYVDVYDQGLNMYSKNGHDCPDTIHWPIVHNRLQGTLKEELHHFLECVIKEKEPFVTGEDGITSLKIALAIMKSLKQKAIIQL